MLHAFMKEASNTESTRAAPFCFKSWTTLSSIMLMRRVFSDFADELAEDTSGVAFFGCFDEAEFSKPQICVE